MYLSETSHVEKVDVRRLKPEPRDDWNFEIRMGKGRWVYASYEEMKSLWFAIGAALSEYEDEMGMNAPWNNEPVPFTPVMPPAVAEFVALPLDEVGQEYEVDSASLGWFTETGGKAHILRGDAPNPFYRNYSLCGVSVVEGHPRRDGEMPCLNCRDIALASSHREMVREDRVKVDGGYAIGQDECLRENGKHEWRWGRRDIDGIDRGVRRHCARCGTDWMGGK